MGVHRVAASALASLDGGLPSSCGDAAALFFREPTCLHISKPRQGEASIAFLALFLCIDGEQSPEVVLCPQAKLSVSPKVCNLLALAAASQLEDLTASQLARLLWALGRLRAPIKWKVRHCLGKVLHICLQRVEGNEGVSESQSCAVYSSLYRF